MNPTPPPTTSPPAPRKSKRRQAPDSADAPAASSTKRSRSRPPSPTQERQPELQGLPTYLAPNLDVLFLGVNAGVPAAQKQRYFVGGNHFWKCLERGGLTDRLYTPDEDYLLPTTHKLGLTTLVYRPTVGLSCLSKAELRRGVPALLDKLAHSRPRILCVLGKAMWDEIAFTVSNAMGVEVPACPDIESGRKQITSAPTTPSPKKRRASSSGSLTPRQAEKRRAGIETEKGKKHFVYGLQALKVVYPPSDDGTEHRETLFYVTYNPSGRVAFPTIAERYQLFVELKDILERVQQGGAESVDSSEFVLVDADTVRNTWSGL